MHELFLVKHKTDAKQRAILRLQRKLVLGGDPLDGLARNAI